LSLPPGAVELCFQDQTVSARLCGPMLVVPCMGAAPAAAMDDGDAGGAASHGTHRLMTAPTFLLAALQALRSAAASADVRYHLAISPQTPAAALASVSSATGSAAATAAAWVDVSSQPGYVLYRLLCLLMSAVAPKAAPGPSDTAALPEALRLQLSPGAESAAWLLMQRAAGMLRAAAPGITVQAAAVACASLCERIFSPSSPTVLTDAVQANQPRPLTVGLPRPDGPVRWVTVPAAPGDTIADLLKRARTSLPTGEANVEEGVEALLAVWAVVQDPEAHTVAIRRVVLPPLLRTRDAAPLLWPDAWTCAVLASSLQENVSTTHAWAPVMAMLDRDGSLRLSAPFVRKETAPPTPKKPAAEIPLVVTRPLLLTPLPAETGVSGHEAVALFAMSDRRAVEVRRRDETTVTVKPFAFADTDDRDMLASLMKQATTQTPWEPIVGGSTGRNGRPVLQKESSFRDMSQWDPAVSPMSPTSYSAFRDENILLPTAPPPELVSSEEAFADFVQSGSMTCASDTTSGNSATPLRLCGAADIVAEFDQVDSNGCETERNRTHSFDGSATPGVLRTPTGTPNRAHSSPHGHSLSTSNSPASLAVTASLPMALSSSSSISGTSSYCNSMSATTVSIGISATMLNSSNGSCGQSIGIDGDQLSLSSQSSLHYSPPGMRVMSQDSSPAHRAMNGAPPGIATPARSASVSLPLQLPDSFLSAAASIAAVLTQQRHGHGGFGSLDYGSGSGETTCQSLLPLLSSEFSSTKRQPVAPNASPPPGFPPSYQYGQLHPHNYGNLEHGSSASISRSGSSPVAALYDTCASSVDASATASSPSSPLAHSPPHMLQQHDDISLVRDPYADFSCASSGSHISDLVHFPGDFVTAVPETLLGERAPLEADVHFVTEVCLPKLKLFGLRIENNVPAAVAASIGAISSELTGLHLGQGIDAASAEYYSLLHVPPWPISAPLAPVQEGYPAPFVSQCSIPAVATLLRLPTRAAGFRDMLRSLQDRTHTRDEEQLWNFGALGFLEITLSSLYVSTFILRDEICASFALQVMCNLAMIDANRRRLAEMGCIEAIMVCMGTTHAKASRVQKDAIVALRHLAYENDENKRRIIDCGGIHAVIRSMASADSPQAATVHKQCCGALAIFAVHSALGDVPRRLICEAGGLNAVLRSVSLFRTDSSLICAALKALGTLLGYEKAKTEARSLGALELLDEVAILCMKNGGGRSLLEQIRQTQRRIRSV
jgi:hypothetical protein